MKGIGDLTSGLGWIDFSPKHRARVESVIELLKPEGRVDELGIGVIRNALSDALFPGTSTIQTRAKYFLIIPRILKDYQKDYENKRTRPPLTVYLKNRENRIVRVLAEKYHGNDETGIFGSRFVGRPGNWELARKPSSIYWTGIRQYGIIRTALSLTEYIARIDRDDSLIDLLDITEEEKKDDKDAGYEDKFGIRLPDNNKGWDKDLTIDLSQEEAGFLRDQIVDRHGHRLIGQVLKDEKLTHAFTRCQNFGDMCDLFREGRVPQTTAALLKLAKDFDTIIHGAHIRYNCMLQERFGTEEKKEEFYKLWEAWRKRLEDDPEVVANFDEAALFELATTLRDFTGAFVRNWIQGLRKQKDTAYFDVLVETQEIRNKQGKARLRPGATEKVGDWIGIKGLSYRFLVVNTIVNDILHGLGD